MEEILKQLARIEKMLVLSSKQALDIDDITLMTGLSKSRIYALVNERRIPFYKPNGRLYFKKSEIEDWMLQNRTPSQSEIESRAATYTTINRR